MKHLLFASTCVLALSVAPLRAQDQPSQEPTARGEQAPAGGAKRLKPGAGESETAPRTKAPAAQRSGQSETEPTQEKRTGAEAQPKREEPRAEPETKGAQKQEATPGKQEAAPSKSVKEAPKTESTQAGKAEEQRKAGETRPAANTRPAEAKPTATEQRKAGDTAQQPAAGQGRATGSGQATEGATRNTGTAATRQGSEEAPAGQNGANRTTATGSENRGASAQVQGKLNLDERRAGDLHQRLVERYRGESTHINENISIGVSIPTSVRVRELPPEIVSEYPEFRGYDFFVQEDEVVIVQPRTREVVEIIGGGRGGRAVREGGSRMHFGRQQSEEIRQVITSDREALAGGGRGPVLRAPESAEIRPLPERVAASMPDPEGYGYFVDREGRVVVVDRSSREVIDIVE